ncbi:hypothetical protein [Candidatus Synchoanobacter obligatus]|uniref:Ankyrin repeat domain-containing protein n=1 Tax=Candidatus Synchoanobacter obligatus TaxID=2919597 RepID=A0ABT1L6X0_9GAMM|nr:hypothetical protein [Candidatus Synchoanobacter obligatus]MCP8352583.1 hypothetical protein [Candidatus Synchoanobacter obligatus]
MRQKRKNIQLVLAVFQKNETEVKKLLADGACLRYICSRKDEGGIFENETALEVAIKWKRMAIAILLIQHGANLMHKVISGGYQGSSMLKLACIKEQKDLVAFMVKKGAEFHGNEVLKLTELEVIGMVIPTLDSKYLNSQYARSVAFCFPILRKIWYTLLFCLSRYQADINIHVFGRLLSEQLLHILYPVAEHTEDQKLAYKKRAVLFYTVEDALYCLAKSG